MWILLCVGGGEGCLEAPGPLAALPHILSLKVGGHALLVPRLPLLVFSFSPFLRVVPARLRTQLNH